MTVDPKDGAAPLTPAEKAKAAKAAAAEAARIAAEAAAAAEEARRKRLPLRPKHRPEPPPQLRRRRVLPLKSRPAIHPRGGHSSSARW